jgi:2,4-dienoyl-CoA reductase-like NADH-dependent reductase (Old Yellow Enzyme family)
MNASIFDSAPHAGIPFRNRLLRSATHESMAESSGAPSPAHEKLYTAIAKGGAGAIITGYCGVQQDGRSSLPGMLMMHDDSLISPYRHLTDAIHRHGTPIILQLAHCGRQTRSVVTGLPTVAPSPRKDFIFNEDRPHELVEQAIEEIIRNFTAAARRAQKAGFDAIQLHIAHGYLLSAFLSSYANRRRDRWGGTTENRFRIVSEILSRIRLELGDFPVLAKINAYDRRPGGMRTAEAVEFARMLEASGCAAIEVSSGTIEEGLSIMRGPELPLEALFACNFRFKKLPYPLKKAVAPLLRIVMPAPKPLLNYNLEAAKAIKRVVSIPVITVGGIHTLEDISGALMNGSTDYVSMSRPFIIEPDIVHKFQMERQTASNCIKCNYCAIMIEEGPLRCWYGKLPQRRSVMESGKLRPNQLVAADAKISFKKESSR